jgi:NADH-quinone oxidoreductase subunit N
MPDILTFHPRDFFNLAPEIILAVWGLVVLMADLGPLRGRTAQQRKLAVGRLPIVGTLIALAASFVPLLARFELYGLQDSYKRLTGIDYVSNPDPLLFFGSISGDYLTDLMNVLFVVLLALVVWLSTVWSFTEDWGEYFALMLWSTVGMMLLAASEEFLTLFLTLEMMTICLYLCTAFEKTKKRSAEGGLKYFVYGSVSSALFLFGLSLVYGLTGSTRFDAIRDALSPGGGLNGLSNNVVGAMALLLVLVGFGFKVAAVPFHQWAPDAYEGAPAPVTAWVATGSKIASFVALMKVLLHALGPWASGQSSVASPGWIGVVAVLSAASMTYGNFAALAQRNFKRMLAYSSIAHAGYMLVGVAAAGVSPRHADAAASVLFYLVVYGFSNVGAFALAAWLAGDKGSDQIDDLNGLGRQHPALATCVLVLMLSLIGMPPFAGFFGKLYMFMEALDESNQGRLTLIWLVALGLANSVVSAFYYVRVLKAMFLRPPSGLPMAPPPSSVSASIVLATVVAVGFGVYPAPLLDVMKAAAYPMLVSNSGVGRPSKFSGPTEPLPKPEAPAVDPAIYEQMMRKGQPGGSATPPAPPSIPAPAAKEKAQEKAKGAETKTRDQPKAKN